MASLKEKSFAEASFSRTTYTANPELGVTTEDLLKPSYWSNVAYKLKPLDTIEARAEDGSFYAELLVRDRGRAWVKVVFKPGYPLVFEDITAVPEMDMDEFVIKWAGPQNKFRVLRKKDNAILKEQFTDKETARKWVIEYMKSLER